MYMCGDFSSTDLGAIHQACQQMPDLELTVGPGFAGVGGYKTGKHMGTILRGLLLPRGLSAEPCLVQTSQ